jgi:hypothetical protein
MVDETDRTLDTLEIRDGRFFASGRVDHQFITMMMVGDFNAAEPVWMGNIVPDKADITIDLTILEKMMDIDNIKFIGSPLNSKLYEVSRYIMANRDIPDAVKTYMRGTIGETVDDIVELSFLKQLFDPSQKEVDSDIKTLAASIPPSMQDYSDICCWTFGRRGVLPASNISLS